MAIDHQVSSKSYLEFILLLYKLILMMNIVNENERMELEFLREEVQKLKFLKQGVSIEKIIFYITSF